MIEPREVNPKEVVLKEIGTDLPEWEPEKKQVEVENSSVLEQDNGQAENTFLAESYVVKIENYSDTEPYVIKSDKKTKKEFPFYTTILFILVVLYYEIVFHIHYFKINDGNLGYILIFSVGAGMFLSIMTNLFVNKFNKAVAIFFTCLLSLLFIAQMIYHEVFQNYLSFAGTIAYGNQAVDNYATVLRNLKENIPMLILLLTPIVLVCVLVKKMPGFGRRKWWINLCLLAGVFMIHICGVWVMKLNDKELYSAYQVYRQYISVDMAVEKLGVCETFVVDITDGMMRALDMKEDTATFQVVDISGQAGDHSNENAGFVDESEADSVFHEDHSNMTDRSGNNDLSESTEEIVDESPNVLDINFDEINQVAGNEGVKALNTYLEGLTPTNKNQYTGMFEGYNLIWITAEAFSGYVLESRMFPTLSMLANEGFVFQNYYSPLWYGSTLGGEYANLMGSMPREGGYLSLSYTTKNGNSIPFTMGNQLRRKGYTTIAYHDNSSTYYDRNISHPALGYEWIANGTGLDAQRSDGGSILWPQSDLVMVQETFDDFAGKEPFHIYYLTVSGHVEYNFSGNAMSAKNREVVSDLTYSETTRAYIAAQYELELALTELIERLKESGLYEKTVIVLAGDHVPYDNMSVLDELAGDMLEDNFEAYKSTLVIWSGSMEEPIHVNKVCSSIDILPTVSNLFGLEYDSRLLIGQDILSDSPGLVMFNNRSYITDTFSYNSVTGNVLSRNGRKISEEEVENMSAFVANKFMAADSITQYNYYSFIEKYLSD